MTDRPPFDERSSRRYATKPVPVAAGTIDLIELALRRDDPMFVRRFHRLQRASRINAVAVVLSLLASAVLLVVGLATASTTGLIGGGVALMIAFTIDGHHRRRLARRDRVELRVRRRPAPWSA